MYPIIPVCEYWIASQSWLIKSAITILVFYYKITCQTIPTLTNWILIETLATPIIPVFQYPIVDQADYSCVLVFGYVSGWCMYSRIEYSVKLRLRLLLSSNMQFNIWLTPTHTNWIFSEASATPMTPIFQYSIGCQAADTNQFNIQ